MAGPSVNLDDALVIDEDDNFFATAERLSQEEEEVQPTQGLLGLDGPVTPLKIELERYLTMPRLPQSKVDVLVWWKDHQHVLPLLSEAARKYLCVTASSASAERLFSASGKVITPLRSRFDPANVNKIVYLHENLKKLRSNMTSPWAKLAKLNLQQILKMMKLLWLPEHCSIQSINQYIVLFRIENQVKTPKKSNQVIMRNSINLFKTFLLSSKIT